MPTTMTDIAAEDTLDAGRIKINTNEDALSDQANALEAAQASHVAAGHPSLYYAKSEVDSDNAAQDATTSAADAAQTLALTTHKASGDHDSRYVAASYLATLVRTTLVQTIDGLKTFLQNLVVKSATNTPSFQLCDGYGNLMGLLRAGKSGANNQVAVSIQDNGATKDILMATEGNGAVNFPNHDVQAKGKILATQDYVTDAVSTTNKVSGAFFYIDRSVSFDNLIGGPPGSVNLIDPVFVGQPAYLTEIGLSRVGSDVDNKIYVFRAAALSIPITSAWHNILKVVLSIDINNVSTLDLFGALGIINQLTSSDVEWDNLQSIILSQGDITYRGATQISVYLKFELPAVGEAIAPPIQQ